MVHGAFHNSPESTDARYCHTGELAITDMKLYFDTTKYKLVINRYKTSTSEWSTTGGWQTTSPVTIDATTLMVGTTYSKIVIELQDLELHDIVLNSVLLKKEETYSNPVKSVSEKFVYTSSTSNIFNELEDTVVYWDYKYATVYLNGYSGTLMVSTLGNYANYLGHAHVYDATGTDTSLSFSEDSYWNGTLTRRGKTLTIPSGSVTLTFRWQYQSSGGNTLASDIMVTSGTTVPNDYIAYIKALRLVGCDYITEQQFGVTVYVSNSGNDDNDGLTIDNAVATISHALTIGNRVFVERGSYTDRISIENIHNITIMPYDNDDIYSHQNPVREKITITGTSVTNRAKFVGCNHLYLEDIIFDTASGSVLEIDNSNDVVLVNCEAKNSSGSMGFAMNNTDAVFYNCYATQNHTDGFNFHGYGTTIMNDCVSEDNDDDGCSHHDGCIGTINGGRFSGNGKAGIAPAYGASVNIYNAVCDENVIGIGYLSTDTGHAAMKGIINSCALVGNERGLVVDSLCAVTTINCKYSGNTTDKDIDGTLAEY